MNTSVYQAWVNLNQTDPEILQIPAQLVCCFTSNQAIFLIKQITEAKKVLGDPWELYY